ncbi:hypothetical protein IMG5_047210 [Ichthyophthirius multifiliis]|uniref:DNA polymerase n=1 Tax=Ichthyophthirius multifiliis TaxID=5932 RepID=G0QMA9_ICHMU|nr:hypothetical protein IMG5_047210 [Ichthyophthirius multifiliis]EGR33649.1 hypothetical protein IMG5_047210 [Ichthyophthirius multifiliis]|eukprot:XP_004037635.1 hypothetical protein IMG5_047210 [Ichthyophthirius multifiliis]
MQDLPIYQSQYSQQFFNDFPFYKELTNYKGNKIKQVPIIRLFGANKYGQKCCLNIHKVQLLFIQICFNFQQKVFSLFLYQIRKFRRNIGKKQYLFYIQSKIFFFFYQKKQKKIYKKDDYLIQFGQQLDEILDKLLNIKQGIKSIEHVKRKDIYGFYKKEQSFLKILYINPSHNKKIQEILTNGALNNIKYQIYEGHLTFFMHFYSDNCIFGMKEITVMNFKFRINCQEYEVDCFEKIKVSLMQRNKVVGQIENQQVNLKVDFSENNIFSNQIKKSTCYIEADVEYNNIINILDFIEENGDLQKFVFSQAINDLWEDEQKRRQIFKIEQKLNVFENKQIMIQVDDIVNQMFKNDQVRFKLQRLAQFKAKQQKNGIYMPFQSIECFINSKQNEQNIIKINFQNKFQEYKNRKQEILQILIKQNKNKYQQKVNNLFNQQDEQDEENMKDVLNILNENQNKNILINNTNSKQSIKQYLQDFCYNCQQLIPFCKCHFINDKINYQNSKFFIKQNKTKPIQNFYIYKQKSPLLKTTFQSINKNTRSDIKQYAYFENIKDFFSHYGIKQNKEDIPLLFQAQILSLLNEKQGKDYIIDIKNILKLPKFTRVYTSQDYGNQFINNINTKKSFNYLQKPPSLDKICYDIQEKQKNSKKALNNIISPWKNNRISQKKSMKNENINQNENSFVGDITVMFLECFAKSFPKKLPNPQNDQIFLIIFSVQNQKHNFQQKKIKNVKKQYLYIYIEINESISEILIVRSETDLIKLLILIVQKIDPDILCGWDTEQQSLGYIIQRCETLGIQISDYLSRCPSNIIDLLNVLQQSEFLSQNQKEQIFSNQNLSISNSINSLDNSSNAINSSSNDENEENLSKFQSNKLVKQKQVDFLQKSNSQNSIGGIINPKYKTQNDNTNIKGRMILNTWRVAKEEFKFTNYDLQNVYYELFGIKNPVFSNSKLSFWFNMQEKSIVLNYFLNRVQCIQQILEKMDTIQRTTASARLYGCDFESILTRGTQFIVEGVLNRVCKQIGFLLLSASKQQVSAQKILECTPLVLQPQKSFYVEQQQYQYLYIYFFKSPIIVLDFQSLYPSIIIAYNYCYSTCLGNINELYTEEGKKRLGVIRNYDFQLNSLKQIEEKLFISPNEVAFVKKSVRQGVLPQILHEFLLSRIMIKESAKYYKKNEYISKLLQARQQSIKNFMNVVYGYAGASFSGRMPCNDLADSIVDTGKYILQEVIRKINSNSKWNAKVVYGDTDSVFVICKGRNPKESHFLGEEIASEISKVFPYPIELKFEKVYSELVICSKKHYVGFKVQENFQNKVLDCKGMELVRRDGCESVQKILRECMYILFESKNLSLLKSYLVNQWSKVLNNQINFKDFVIAKEVKLGKYGDNKPPHAVVGLKNMQMDKMDKPKYGQRVQYLVVRGDFKAKIRDLVVSVQEFVNNKHKYSLNSFYYIKHQINAAVGRVLATMNIDINVFHIIQIYIYISFIQDWLEQIPKGITKKNIINEQKVLDFYNIQNCVICQNYSKEQICKNCQKNERNCSFLIENKIKLLKQDLIQNEKRCLNCSSFSFQNVEDVPCVEYNCSYFFEKKRAKDQFQAFGNIIKAYNDLFLNKDLYNNLK